jgi:hypothetical protein
MGKTIYYRLEYKEQTGDFHFEDDKTHPENIAGWRTISRGIPESRCINFVEKMSREYPGKVKAPIFEIVYNEFFIKN